MKIRPDHYATMRDAIATIPADKIQEIRNHVLTSDRVHNREKCFRWNLSYAAKLTPFICDNVYSYADDTHIDTALRSIVRELSISL